MDDHDSLAPRSELWEDHELEMCPSCGSKRLTPRTFGMNGYRICLDCGVVGLQDGQPPTSPAS